MSLDENDWYDENLVPPNDMEPGTSRNEFVWANLMNGLKEGALALSIGLSVFVLAVLIPLGSLAYSTFVFLREGQFPIVTLNWFLAIPSATGWVGVDQIVSWVINDVWIGFFSLALLFLGFLALSNSK